MGGGTQACLKKSTKMWGEGFPGPALARAGLMELGAGSQRAGAVHAPTGRLVFQVHSRKPGKKLFDGGKTFPGEVGKGAARTEGNSENKQGLF